MRKTPPLNSLKCFEAAARNGSFHGAADELCVSVSAISHQIKQLEVFLNLELFYRKPRTIELTEAGNKYYPILRDAFDRIADGTAALLKPQDSNHLTLQLYSTIAIRWLIPKLNEFHKKYPDINVRIHTSYQDVDFGHSDVDACIKIGTITDRELDYCYLFTSELFPVCSPTFLKEYPELTNVKNLADAPILQVYPSRIDWSLWLEQAKVNGVEPDSSLRFDSYDHALTTALQGLGIAMGMQPYVFNEFASGMLVEPYPQFRCKHPDSWYFVCRKEKADLQKVRLFKNWLIAEIESSAELANLRK